MSQIIYILTFELKRDIIATRPYRIFAVFKYQELNGSFLHFIDIKL